jgi:hypothetical protein
MSKKIKIAKKRGPKEERLIISDPQKAIDTLLKKSSKSR